MVNTNIFTRMVLFQDKEITLPSGDGGLYIPAVGDTVPP